MDQKFNRNACVGAMAAALLASGTLKPLSDETQATAKGRRRDGRPNVRPGQSSGLHKNHTANEYRRQAVANSVNGCGPRIRRARDAWIKKIEEETGRRLTKAERGKAIENFNALKPYQGAL